MGQIPIGFHFKFGSTILRTSFNRTTILCRAGTLNIYSVKIALHGVSPIIWRRLRLSGETSLAEFNHIIQIAMGWDEEYLHQFYIYGKDYGISYAGGFIFSDDASLVRLDDFDFDAGDRFTYTYNFLARPLEAAGEPNDRDAPIFRPTRYNTAKAVSPENLYKRILRWCRSGWGTAIFLLREIMIVERCDQKTAQRFE